MPHLSRFLSGLALMLTLPLSGCLDTGPDVVCVDVERVLSQSKAAQQANEHLGKVQTILRNGLAAYQEELKKSPEEKRQQELRQGLTLLQRQMALEQAAARDVVSKHMLAQIEAWRADKGDVAVMARQNVLSAPASMDITAVIISRMDAGSVQFAELPRVSIRTHADGPDESMAETVAKVFQNAGYDFRVIHGGMSVKERSELINLLRTGAIAGLVNAELLTYGFDCPCVSYAFSCRHIKSRPLWFQIVGRILRICDGKEDAIFVDHGDSISEFSEPSCSLPILDPLMQWKYDGETKEQRAEVRKKIKRAQDAMKKLQEIDPLPIDMVEVTVEDTWERMMRIIQKQQTDIENLKKEKETIESEHQKQTQDLINARTSLTKCQYDNNELKQKNKQIQTDYQRQNQELAYAKSSLSRLQQENIVLKQRTNQSGNTNGVRKLDKDETFEFIRRRYASIREQCHSHQQTVLEMQKAFSRDRLQYDKDQFNNSMYWWSNHYQEPADYKSDLPWK